MGIIFVVGLVNIYLMIPTFIMGVIIYFVAGFYSSTYRSVKRLEIISEYKN